MKTHFARCMFAALFALTGTAAQAQANPAISFSCITDASAANCAVGESALSLTWTQTNNSAVFSFSNGSSTALVDHVYFDWAGTTLTLSAIGNGNGVRFTADATPALLAGDTTFLTNLSASANGTNRLNPGEQLTFSFLTEPSYSVANALGSGTLRVGLHAGFGGQANESFVSVASQAPEPQTYAMLLAGLALVSVSARRHRRA